MAKKEGPHYRFEEFEFWAENGLISLLNHEKASDSDAHVDKWFQRLSPGEFMKRAITAYLVEPPLYPSKIAERRKMLENAQTAVKLAKKQGDPTEDSTLEHVVKHQRKSSIVMPHELPPITDSGGHKLKLEGKTPSSVFKEGVETVSDIQIAR